MHVFEMCTCEGACVRAYECATIHVSGVGVHASARTFVCICVCVCVCAA